MTRINTNISSLTAQNSLQRSNAQLQTALTRLSTGLRINVGKDDPAGLIASEALKSDITAVTKAISNSERANEMIATADSALGQVSDLLNDVRGLVSEAANTGAMSADQIAANQLQVDSSLDAINRISQVTSFQGRRLLDGSLDFITETWTNKDKVSDLQINSVNMGTADALSVDVNVDAAATQGVLKVAITAGGSVAATTTMYTNDGGSLAVTAPNADSAYNGVVVKFVKSADVAAASPTAAYNSSSKELTVTVNNSSATSLSSIASAIGTQTSFTAVGSAGTYFNPAADSGTSEKATGTLTFADGTTIQLQAKDASALYNANVVFATNSAIGTSPTLAWSSTGVQTITVDTEDGNTAAQIANAFNTSANSKFTATVLNDGGTGYSVTNDSPTGAAAVAASQSYTFGVNSVTVNANVAGTGGNAYTIAYTYSGNAAGTAVSALWGGGGGNTLTVTFDGAATLDAIASQITTDGASKVWGQTATPAATAGTTAPPSAALLGGAAAKHKANIVTSGGFTGINDRAVAMFNFTTNSGKLLVQAAASGSAGNAYTVAFTNTGASGGASAAWGAGADANKLTVTVGNDCSIAAIAAEINDHGTGKLSASTTTPSALTGADDPADQALAGGGGMSGASNTGGLGDDLVFQLKGLSGTQVFSFDAGTTGAVIEAAVNLVKDATGVEASWDGTGNVLRFLSTAYGSDAFVDVGVVSEGASGTFGSGLQTMTGAAATRSEGTDVVADVNGVNATGKANTLSLNTATLSLNMTVAANFMGHVTFDISGGGAEFQLGPDVVSNQQARIGIGSVNTATLGGTSGRLYTLGSGEENSLETDPTAAALIVDEVITKVTSLRGRLGAFQKATLESNISSLTDTQENLTAAQSAIRDADFAAESANLTRAQILVQSGTSVLGIANQNPQNVLSLLR
jgi:flagellin